MRRENRNQGPGVSLRSEQEQDRRAFLTSATSGLGAAALGSLLTGEAIAAPAEADPTAETEPPASTTPADRQGAHFPPTAKRAIFIYLAGGTSQIELFDPKPKLTELTGKGIPESFNKKELFAFVKPESAKLMGSRFPFRRYGQSGLEMSSLLPHVGSMADDIAVLRSLHTDSFDHGPAEILFSTGEDSPGRPSAGAWISYGLGSEAENLPAYVVLMTGRGPVSRGLAWGSGFLPTQHAGVLFRSRGEPVLNLASPPGVTLEAQRSQLDALRDLNRQRLETVLDPSIQNRIDAYELAFRMQMAAPELVDFRRESQRTLESYGVGRDGAEANSFAVNCVLARRLVERGVRFVSIFHRRWDHHAAVEGGVRTNCHVVDQPIGALLRDLKERGLLDETLVIWGTEFGRTPMTQNSEPGPGAGRDHHRYAFSTWMAGGGVRGGTVVGQTDELGFRPIEDSMHVNDFHATMLHLLGLDHLRLTYRFKGLDFRLTDQGGEVMEKVIG